MGGPKGEGGFQDLGPYLVPVSSAELKRRLWGISSNFTTDPFSWGSGISFIRTWVMFSSGCPIAET